MGPNQENSSANSGEAMPIITALYQPALKLTLCHKKAKWQGSSSFLEKRTKKLLLDSVRASRIGHVNQQSKSLLVLFFRKELLPCFAGVSVPMRVGIRYISSADKSSGI
jgi:hypothetical protein